MESRGWHVTLLQIMLLLVLLALPAAADCTWDSLTDFTLHYEGYYTSQTYRDSFKDGEQGPYKCQDGYFPSDQYSGPRVLNATCRGNDKWEWDSRNLQCRPVSCGHPCPNGHCKNGDVTPLVFNFPQEVTFTCKKGYHLVTHDDQYWDPHNVVYCMVDGKWSRPTPKCVEIMCPQPTPIADGKVDPPQGIFRENATIQYSCNQGFTLIGDATRRCQNDARWSGNDPTCEPGGTAKTCSSPLPIPNGVVNVPPGSKLGVNTKAEYRCNTGYQLVGVAERFCQEDGTWSGQEPYCQAAFPTTTCPPLGPIVHGDVIVEPGPIHVNTRAEYRCDVDYTLIGDKERLCQLDGTWSGTEPVCHDANADTCPMPPPIVNGDFKIAPGPIVVRTRIEYRCNAGYALVGPRERFCELDGFWSGYDPICRASCPAPSRIANGDVLVPGGELLPDTPVQYVCNTGYTLIGPQVRLCQPDGTWSGTEPFCQSGTGPRNCPAPAPIANGDIEVPPGPLVANTRVLYRCNAGYTLIGVSERLCKPDGTWTGAQPVCQSGSGPLLCPAPGSIPNGAVDLPSGALVVNTRVQYRCNAGYTLIGTMERVCQPDGSWSGTEPVCQAAAPAPTTCPAPGPIANGAVDVPPGRLVVNTKVQYRCNAGYTLVGMTERICQADGTWSNTEPMCQGSPSPAGEDKTQPDNSNEAQMTSWVLLALMAILVVAGAVVLYMAYQFYLSSEGAEDAAALVAHQNVETKSVPLP